MTTRAMRALTLAYMLGIAAAFTTRSSASRNNNDVRVRLDDVKVLTLYKSRETAGRRSAPVPHLSCQGGCNRWTPDMVQCYNMGSDGVDAAWKCEASMPDGYSFASVQVGCEGFDYPEDPYILKDSCQLIYSLKGPRHNGRRSGSWHDDGEYRGSWGAQSTHKGLGSRLVTWAALGVVGFIVYNAIQGYINAHPDRPLMAGGGGEPGSGGGGAGGGGGGGGDNWRGSSAYPDPPSKGAPGATAPSAPAAYPAQQGGLFPWLAGGGIGAALGYFMRPPRRDTRVRRRASDAWAFRDGSAGASTGGGAYRRRDGSGSGGGDGGRGGGLQAGYGGTSRR